MEESRAKKEFITFLQKFCLNNCKEIESSNFVFRPHISELKLLLKKTIYHSKHRVYKTFKYTIFLGQKSH